MTHVCAHIRFSVQLKVQNFRDENVHGCFCIRPREKKITYDVKNNKCSHDIASS